MNSKNLSKIIKGTNAAFVNKLSDAECEKLAKEILQTNKVISKEPEPIIFFCENCGSKNIEQKIWVNANTNEKFGTISAMDDRWCCDCEEHVNFVTDPKLIELPF